MDVPLNRLELNLIGPADASVGMLSLPIPRSITGALRADCSRYAFHPLAWWERGRQPRRSMLFVLADPTLPNAIHLTAGEHTISAVNQPGHAEPAPWSFEAQITRQQLHFTPHRFADIQALRGVPASDCTTVEFELLLRYRERLVRLQFGSTGPKGGPYWWQNVHIDPLWSNHAAQAIRVGGIIYNEDTYLWVDLFLLLFANGVAHAAAHFRNTKLHIEGYDFTGLPVIRFAGDGIESVQARVPADGLQFDLGSLRLNLAESAILCSAEHPGRLEATPDAVLWRPFSRTFNPQVPDAPKEQWAPGFQRTARFQFSLSDDAPTVARYSAPAWWYALSDEPWPGGYLPVRGACTAAAESICELARSEMTRGRFDGGSAGNFNDGYAGAGLLANYYLTGHPQLFADALDYIYYWADLAVDHRDYTVHQWIGGWGWKTCAYLKFRDVLYGYLETADPTLLDTAEMCAEAYWMWFRSNWPRCDVGRDSFEFGAWALMRRYLRTEHARERIEEFTRMLSTLLESRGVVGGQMGAGPHPGYHSSLYMTGVAMSALLEIAEAKREDGDTAFLHSLRPLLEKLHSHFMRDDVELFPSNYGQTRAQWGKGFNATWSMLAIRIYPQIARLYGGSDALVRSALDLAYRSRLADPAEWAKSSRPGHSFINPHYHDSLLLGAQWSGSRLHLAPIGTAEQWPAEQRVDTPIGPVIVKTAPLGESFSLAFESSDTIPLTVHYRGATIETTSPGTCRLSHAATPHHAGT